MQPTSAQLSACQISTDLQAFDQEVWNGLLNGTILETMKGFLSRFVGVFNYGMDYEALVSSLVRGRVGKLIPDPTPTEAPNPVHTGWVDC